MNVEDEIKTSGQPPITRFSSEVIIPQMELPPPMLAAGLDTDTGQPKPQSDEPIIPSYDLLRRKKRRFERLAKLRTSEFMVRLLAAMAVRIAIKSNRPEIQDRRLRAAEMRHLQRLWAVNIRKELQLNR